MSKSIGLLMFSLSFFVSSMFIYHGILRVGRENVNYVSVKGLSEKEVISNSASWSIRYEIVGNTINEINKINKFNFNKVKSFFKKHGFNDSDINFVSLRFDVPKYRDSVYKYEANVNLLVTTREIDKMEKANKNVFELYNSGVLFAGYDSRPSYIFDKINDLKPEMLADSVKNSKIAALEIIKNSNSSLGKIKNIVQGYFEFLPIDRSSKSHEGYSKKILRVVTTVSYYLK